MAILNIRQLPGEVHANLRVRAARNGRSMEAEARSILASACATEYDAPEGSGQVRDASDDRLTISLTPRQAEAANKYASEHHTTVEDLVRQLLDRELGVDVAAQVRDMFARMDEAGGDLRGQTWARDELYRV